MGVGDGIDTSGGRQKIVDARVGGKELSGEAVIADGVLVGEGKGIALEAERASPGLGGCIQTGVRVEDAATCATRERGVREDGKVRDRRERAAHDGQRNHHLLSCFA